MNAFTWEGAAIAARWAIAVSGLIIAVNYIHMWRRDRDRRADRYQNTVLRAAISIGVVFPLLLVSESGWHGRGVQILEIFAGCVAISHAIASVQYSEWLHLVARWARGRTDNSPS